MRSDASIDDCPLPKGLVMPGVLPQTTAQHR